MSVSELRLGRYEKVRSQRDVARTPETGRAVAKHQKRKQAVCQSGLQSASFAHIFLYLPSFLRNASMMSVPGCGQACTRILSSHLLCGKN
eukprot:6178186-Pleurochrysis_carterae.AAC.3